jgi:hypothetical protein
MALEGFRPTIWSKSFITNMEKALVFKNVVNTDYEGDIAGGARSVKINELGSITINDYTEDTDITVQTLTDAQKELVIDQKKYFAFNIDDVLKAQSNVTLMERAMQMAAFNMSDVIDQYIAGLYLGAGVTTANMGTNATDLDIYATGDGHDQLISVFTNASRYLDEANAPTIGRWVVVPPWMHQYLKQAQIVDNTTGAIKGGDTTAFGNGYIGNTLGFDIYASNNVSSGASWVNSRVMFGTRDAISFAGQITKIATSEVEKQFGTMVKGLYVYGAKVVRPDHLLTAYLAPAGLSS